VITRSGEKLFPLTDRRQKGNQFSQLCFIEMAELLAVSFVNPVLHLLEQVQTAPRNPGDDVAPILAASLADNQLRLFETIEKTRDVRDLAHQSFRDFTPAQPRRLRSPQNPKNVVLRRRNAVRLQGGLECVLQ